jgi:hypothetical protein
MAHVAPEMETRKVYEFSWEMSREETAWEMMTMNDNITRSSRKN